MVKVESEQRTEEVKELNENVNENLNEEVGGEEKKENAQAEELQNAESNENNAAQNNEQEVEISFTSQTELENIGIGESKKLLVMSSMDSPNYEPKERAAMDLILVIDVSGSMSGHLTLVKNTIEFLIQQVQAKDTISLITFATEVQKIFPSMNMDAESKAKATKLVQSLKATSSTNLSGGLLTGIAQVMELREKKGYTASESRTQAILLMTDGQANVGISKTEDIIKAAQAAISDVPKCDIFTFGFGKDHSETLLRGLSDITTNGMYFFIESRDKIPEVFVDCFGGLMSILCQSVRIELKPLNGCKIEEFLSDYQIVTSPEDGTISSDMSDIYSEEHRDILVNMFIPPQDEEKTLEVMECTLRFYNVVSNKFQVLRSIVTIAIVKAENVSTATNTKVNSHHNQILTFRALEAAKKVADRNDFQSAQNVLQTALHTIQVSPSCDSSYSIEMMEEIKEALGDMESKQRYIDLGSKKMALKSKKISKQKCSAMHKKEMMNREYKRQFEARSPIDPFPINININNNNNNNNISNNNNNISLPTPPHFISGPMAYSNIGSVVHLKIGNLHEDIPESEAPVSKSDPTKLCLHKWTVFVRCSQPNVIEKVKFELHSSFKEPNPIILSSEPFELTRNGWGSFRLPITVYFNPAVASVRKEKFFHLIRFDDSLIQADYTIPLLKSTLPAPIPTPTLTPPVANDDTNTTPIDNTNTNDI